MVERFDSGTVTRHRWKSCRADNDEGAQGLGTGTDRFVGYTLKAQTLRACRMEQACKSWRTLILSRGCENLRMECGKCGNLFVTSSDDGAERDKTQEGVGLSNQ